MLCRSKNVWVPAKRIGICKCVAVPQEAQTGTILIAFMSNLNFELVFVVLCSSKKKKNVRLLKCYLVLAPMLLLLLECEWWWVMKHGKR